MRKRERERFQRMNFSDAELGIRDRLYKEEGCKKETALYKIIITEEHYNNKKRIHQKEGDSDCQGYSSGYLAYFSDYPEDGLYVDTIYFSYPRHFRMILSLYEGLFYQLFDNSTGKRIGYGSFDPDSPVEEIRETIKDCCGVCEFCFWHGMLYNEEKEGSEYKCYFNEYEWFRKVRIRNLAEQFLNVSSDISKWDEDVLEKAVDRLADKIESLDEYKKAVEMMVKGE